jgi:hypothetical protein
MSIYSLFETDIDRESAGFAMTFQDGDVEVTINIARAGGSNKAYAALMQKLLRPHQLAASSGGVNDDIAEEILIRVMSETLVTGWSGIYDRDGEELPFSVETCKKVLTDLPQLRENIWEEANRVANFMMGDREESAKN